MQEVVTNLPTTKKDPLMITHGVLDAMTAYYVSTPRWTGRVDVSATGREEGKEFLTIYNGYCRMHDMKKETKYAAISEIRLSAFPNADRTAT